MKTSKTKEKLCPECFKVVGDPKRYQLVCLLAGAEQGMTVTELTNTLDIGQSTVSHHLSTLHSIDAVTVESRGRERVYQINKNAHCFEECHIPYE